MREKTTVKTVAGRRVEWTFSEVSKRQSKQSGCPQEHKEQKSRRGQANVRRNIRGRLVHGPARIKREGEDRKCDVGDSRVYSVRQ